MWENEKGSLEHGVPSRNPLAMFIDGFCWLIWSNNEFEVTNSLCAPLIMQDHILACKDVIKIDGPVGNEV